MTTYGQTIYVESTNCSSCLQAPTTIFWFRRAAVNSIKFPTAVRQVEQAPTSYLSAVENFRFSTMHYCTVELASAAKLTRYSLQGREVIFHMTHRGYWYSQSLQLFSVQRFRSDCCSTQAVERSYAILPPPISTSVANICCASSQRQPSLKEQHSLREQGRLRTG